MVAQSIGSWVKKHTKEETMALIGSGVTISFRQEAVTSRDEMFRNKLLSFMKKSPLVTKDDLYQQREYSLYSIFQILLFSAETRPQINSILENRDWFWLKNTLIGILRKSPEVYFFLDSIDSEYEHAPLHWLMCQKGLFYAVLSFLQQSVLGEKLHLIITLRDNVLLLSCEVNMPQSLAERTTFSR